MIKLKDILIEDCWKGYKQIGMKKKGKKTVPNCVPIEEAVVEPEPIYYAATHHRDEPIDPIVPFSDLEKEVVKLVNEIIQKRRLNPGCDVSDIEMELDSLVCDIYGLDDIEKKQILGSAR